MSKISNPKAFAFFVVVLIIAFSLGLLLYQRVLHSPSVIYKAATVLPESRLLPAFSLVDMNNKPFSNKNLKGNWSLIFFGFTHCPMVCPTTLSTLNKVYQKLEADHISPLPNMLFVSVDPERDTPKVMKAYVLPFNSRFMGLIGEKQHIDRLTKQLGAVYMKINASERGRRSTSYNIDHSGAVFLIDPRGDFYALFSSPNDVNEMVLDLEKILK